MSRYENYVMKNNVFGELYAPISSLATTIQLKDGQGQRFSVNQLATLENIENGKVMKREIVLITAINGDALTVERKYAPCPANDDANTQGKVSYAFSTDDTISVYITKEHFDEIDKSINDIYDNGVNKLRTEVVSGLQIKVNAGPVLVGSAYYDFDGGNLTLTDNATNYLEIDEDGLLVNNTTSRHDENTKLAIITTSSGSVTNIKDRRLGTIGGKIGGVNIHDLTEKTILNGNDEFILSDSENIWNNKKVKYKNLVKFSYGTGSDGSLHITSDMVDSETGIYFMDAKEYNFVDFVIDSGVKVMFQGNGIPLIRTTHSFVNNGEIDLYAGNQFSVESVIHSMSIGNIATIYNTIGITPSYSGGTGGSGSNGGPGGNGGGEGEVGGNGTGNSAGSGGQPGNKSGGGGGGGGPNATAINAGQNGGDGGDGIGGKGGNGGNRYAYTGGGGGGGYGYLKGGNGGDSYGINDGGKGGNGGDSMFEGGNGGNGIQGGGNGGFGFRTKGGNGGNGANGGDSIYGTGGNGHNGGNGRNGGDSVDNGTGGNAWGGIYGLGIFTPYGTNNIINASGGNGGNSVSGTGGNGSDGGFVGIISEDFTKGTINVSGGNGGTGGTSGQSGKDGTLLFQNIIF